MEETEDIEDIFFDPEQQARLEKSIKEKLVSFFSKYRFYCGGPIPSNLICSNDSLNLVLKVPFDPGIKFIYDYVLPSFKNKLIVPMQMEVDWQIEMVLNLLAACRDSHIPIDYQAGILMLYFKHCHGCKSISFNTYQSWQIEDALLAA